ncbi:MAG: FAD-dependent oxidoreductase [Pseudomonadota bacterium]
MTVYAPTADPSSIPRTVFTEGAGAPLGAPALEGGRTADIVVVGGGIAGVSAALHAAEAGAKVILLEANSVGWGASGRNGGHVAAASKLSRDEAIRMYGPKVGERFNIAAENGPDLVFGLADKYGIDAEVQRTGMLIAAHSQSAARTLEQRALEMQSRGRPVEYLDRRAAAAAIGSDLYLGAFRDSRGGSINPLAYVRGLARAAQAAGAEIHENARALSVVKHGATWNVATQRGIVQTSHVIVCTNAYTDDLWPGLKRSIVPARSYHVATAPLSQELREKILPGREVMTDSRRLLIGLRVSKDGRLHFNGYGPALGPDTGMDMDSTIARIEEIYPRLKPVQIQVKWHGWMAMSTANTWEVHELANGVVAALGCNGRGVAMATFIGRDLAEHAMGKPASELIVPFTPLRQLPLHAIHDLPAGVLVTLRKWKDSLEMNRLRRITRRA